MSRYLPESKYQTAKTGILLINLGTPEAPTRAALRPYLKQFLSDPRVVEIPRALWWLILNGIILNTRPAKSAHKYAAIWSKEGSPLMAHTRKSASLLKGLLGERGQRGLVVDYAMRYGQPSIESVIARMREQGMEKLLAVPLYPQYAGSSSASALDEVFRVLSLRRDMPELRTVRDFHDHPGYIQALAARVRRHWQENGQGDKLLLSFHGVPRFTVDKGDPYQRQCLKTAQLLGEALRLPPEKLEVAFQSRFGRAEWLQPYASETLARLGKAKTGRLDVLCPGFVADCLETLEEIAIEGKQIFLQNGGGEFRYLPCLNDDPQWIAALADLAQNQLTGWA